MKIFQTKELAEKIQLLEALIKEKQNHFLYITYRVQI